MSRKHSHTPLYSGEIKKTRKGSAFLIREDGPDIFIDAKDLNGAMNGDIVSCDLLPKVYWRKNPEGIVDHILKRARREISGTLQRRGKTIFVRTSAKQGREMIQIMRGNTLGARPGDKVTCEIIHYPASSREHPIARVREILARRDDPLAELTLSLHSMGIRVDFPDAAEQAAKEWETEDPTDAASRDPFREDLRDLTLITIDGASSKDLDDAVSCEKLDRSHWRLGVHIADVAHYVAEGSPLDEEAFQRGTSVYPVNKVIPMLPTSLSNGICSLFEGADRLALSCFMVIDDNGNIENHKIVESLIRSSARMVYDDVSDILEKQDEELTDRYLSYHGRNIVHLLHDLRDVSEVLNARRTRKGSLDFDIEEPDILYNEQGEPVSIRPASRRIAERLIEECMLAANQTVAGHFHHLDAPFVYRVHERPDADRIRALKDLLQSKGFTLSDDPEKIKPRSLSAILDQTAATSLQVIVNTVMLQAMSKARYSPECEGHFALAFQEYCHFTSPIRRYPDLMIHRIVKTYLHHQADRKWIQRMRNVVEEVSDQSSAAERAAIEAERDMEKVAMATYMKKRIGDTSDGIISGVSDFGIYVRLPNTVEGMIRLDSLSDDYYEYDEAHFQLVGRRHGRIFALGESVQIMVTDADPEERQITFRLLDSERSKRQGPESPKDRRRQV